MVWGGTERGTGMPSGSDRKRRHGAAQHDGLTGVAQAVRPGTVLRPGSGSR